jgi:hypothetical protein
MLHRFLILTGFFLAACVHTVAPEPASDLYPYLVFGGPVQEDARFEPSGAVWDRLGNRYIIFNDKDDEPPVYIYKYNEVPGELELVDTLIIQNEDGAPIKVKKFEDASASLAKDGVIYAITACDREDSAYNVLLRVTLSQVGKPVFEEVPGFKEALTKLRELLGVPYMKIEAMALSPGDKYLYLGIREVGAEYKHPQRVVMIWRIGLEGGSTRPEKVFEMETRWILGRVEGISALEYDPIKGRYLMLTSFEGEGNSKEDVGGHLWALDRESLEHRDGGIFGKAALLASFSHKAEGVSIDGHGRLLIVFDDDASRKEKNWKKAREQNQFNIMQNQAYYLFMK